MAQNFAILVMYKYRICYWQNSN